MKEKDKWRKYCALTCEGGSEKKGCTCISPFDCELRGDPEFTRKRTVAIKKMVQSTRKAVQPGTLKRIWRRIRG